MSIKREDIEMPYHSVMIEHNESFVLNGEVYTSLAEIYNNGYNNGYKKGSQEYKNSFNAGYSIGYDTGYKAGKEI